MTGSQPLARRLPALRTIRRPIHAPIALDPMTQSARRDGHARRDHRALKGSRAMYELAQNVMFIVLMAVWLVALVT